MYTTPSVLQIRVVEDILESMAKLITDPRMSLDAWSKGFITSVNQWVSKYNKALTTEQAKVILRLFAKCRHVLIADGYTTEEQAKLLLDKPRYRVPVTPSRNIPREVRHLGQNRLGFRFKMNDDITAFIDEKINSTIFGGDEAAFDPYTHIWIIPVTRATVEAVIELIGRFGFALDSGVEDLLVETYASFDRRYKFRLVDDQIVVELGGNELLESWVIGPLRGNEV